MNSRIAQIDVLRAIAVFLVLGRHMEVCPEQISGSLHVVTEVLKRGGWIGVDLFFVLSGFLVSGLLFKEQASYGNINVSRFLVRRGFKIYPGFWVLIGVTYLFMLKGNFPPSFPEIFAEVLFYQNYYPPALDHLWWGPTWSLAVEEHFYILLTLLMFLMSKFRSEDPFKPLPWLFGFVALTCLLLRLAIPSSQTFKHATHMFPSHLRLDSLFFGVLLSYVFHRHPEPFIKVSSRFRWLLIIVGSVIISTAFCFQVETTRFLHTYGLTILYLGSGCILCAALGFGDAKSKVLRALAYIGAHSYSIYLWHMFVQTKGQLYLHKVGFGQNWYCYLVLYVGGSLLFGIASAKIIEFPVLKIRDRWFPSRSNSAKEPTASQMVDLKAVPH